EQGMLAIGDGFARVWIFDQLDAASPRLRFRSASLGSGAAANKPIYRRRTIGGRTRATLLLSTSSATLELPFKGLAGSVAFFPRMSRHSEGPIDDDFGADPTAERPPDQQAVRNKSELLLLVFGSDDSIQTFPLPERGSLTIGRAEGAAIRLNDPSLSRLHAA